MITYKFWSEYKHSKSDIDSINHLLGLLTSSNISVSLKYLDEISINSHLLLSINSDNKIIGMATLAITNIPTGRAAHIEDVVVDENYQHQGIGYSLIEKLIAQAKKNKITKIELTCKPERVSANKLYPKFNFTKIETNVYRLKL